MKRAKHPPCLPRLAGAQMLGRICLHPPKVNPRVIDFQTSADWCRRRSGASPVEAEAPSDQRLKEDAEKKKETLKDHFSRFLSSHEQDRPWRRDEGDLPLWNPKQALSNQAALRITKIASEFCSWYRNLGGNELIDESSLLAMFAVRFPEPASGATQVLVRQLKPHELPTRLRLVSPIRPVPPALPRPQVKQRRLIAFGSYVPAQEYSSRSQRPPCRAPPFPQPPEGLLELKPTFKHLPTLQTTRGLYEGFEDDPTKLIKHLQSSMSPRYSTARRH